MDQETREGWRESKPIPREPPSPWLIYSTSSRDAHIWSARAWYLPCITDIRCYYTSDSLWKIWLVESIQSIHNSLWTWHDKCNICCRYCIYHVKFNVCRLLSPLECSPQKQNGRTLRFCFWGWIMWKMYNKTIIEFGFRMISWIIKTSVLIIHDIMLNLNQ